VFLERYDEEIPSICKILSEVTDSGEVEVEWWFGKYTTDWKVCKRRIGRTVVPWTETIKRSSFLMPVSLTN